MRKNDNKQVNQQIKYVIKMRISSFFIGQKEVKLSLFTDNIITYEENPKDSTKDLLELIN